MKLIGSIVMLLFYFQSAYSQNSFTAYIRDHDSKEPLAGVNIIIEGTQIGGASNENGFIEIKGIPPGELTVIFSFVGYEEQELSLSFPLNNPAPITIFLESETEELEEVSITSMRSSRLIDDEPTRVEVIAGEEIDEKISMDPSNISMMLNESTGIQVQQTSASTANSTFRIQGLDGRYTLLLRDGYPLYTGFSGSLSIMQIPPLDIQQIEIIKGSSSTLYGGGAIAGLINLVSKEPAPEGNLSFLLNGTSAEGIDLSGYYSKKFDKYGITLLASRNTQASYDNNDDQFSDLPEIKRYTINPKLFLYYNKSTLELGGNFIDEKRKGGSIPLIRGNRDSVYTYTEDNISSRFSANARYSLEINESSELAVKSSLGFFDREIILPDYNFSGSQNSSYSELSYRKKADRHDWIFGLNLFTEDFNDKSNVADKRNYNEITTGAFIQNTFDITERYILESGFRLDYNKDYGWFPLPRISLLVKWNNDLSSRIGGGLGYKIPTIFTEEAEEISFRNILPADKNKLEAENSYGFNLDANYKSVIFDEVTFSINQLFFYTRIKDPVILGISSIDNNLLEYTSLDGFYDSKGLETNIKFTYEHLKLFLGYTFMNTRINNSNTTGELPLTPKHKLGIVLIFEEHENYRIGLEGYYTGRQKLSGGEAVRDFWVTGLMAEKALGNINLYINFENFLDTRQSRFGSMYSGTPDKPVFAEIYAPVDGRIINGGIKVRL